MKEFAHAAMDGGCGFAMQLLVEDRFEERFKGRWSSVEAEPEFADIIDECSQIGIAGFQVRDGFDRIEGEFSALSVVNHKRTV
jgi:hypothetical protein